MTDNSKRTGAGDYIGHNFLDRSPDSQFAPGVIRKRTMTTEDNHDLRVS